MGKDTREHCHLIAQIDKSTEGSLEDDISASDIDIVVIHIVWKEVFTDKCTNEQCFFNTQRSRLHHQT